MENTDLIEKLAHLEEREKSNTKRIDNLEIKVEDIHELASSVRLLASETKAMRKDVNDMNSRLKVVEEKPSKNWDKLIWIIITRNCNSSSGFFLRKNRIIERRNENEKRRNFNMD